MSEPGAPRVVERHVWAPFAVLAAVVTVASLALPLQLGGIGAVNGYSGALGLVASVVGVVRDRRTAWRVAAGIAGLVNLAAVALVLWAYLLLRALQGGSGLG